MNRDNLKKETIAEETASAILLTPAGALVSQDLRANSVQPVGVSIYRRKIWKKKR